ncbi:hypothetical protein GCM10007937_60730 [Mesorhizobium albiziae]|nr:hypothetical protein GCM10007937_60730 [Mesorhizobium albiziae]
MPGALLPSATIDLAAAGSTVPAVMIDGETEEAPSLTMDGSALLGASCRMDDACAAPGSRVPNASVAARILID